MIIERTVELIKQIYRFHRILPPRVNRVVIGLGYTGVEILAYAYDPFIGLAYTLPDIIKNTNCTKINFAGTLTEKSFLELLEWSCEPPSLKKIIGIATLNAVSQHVLEVKNPYKTIDNDLIDYLKIDKDTNVIFIGLIKSLIKRVGTITQSITIVENNPNISKTFIKFPIKTHVEQLSDNELETDVLFCTGTTLINDSLEDILFRFKRKARKVIVIGPTASMLPDIFYDHGVDIIGGMKILNSSSVLKIIQEGGGTKLFKNFGKKYYFSKDI